MNALPQNHKIPAAVLCFLGLITLILTPLPSLGQELHIQGRVFDAQGPLPGATVTVYNSYQDFIDASPIKTSEPTDAQGLYSLILNKGGYYFTAQAVEQGRTFFSYHGSNPIKIERDNIWVSFMANPVKLPVYSNGTTSVHGVVTYKGKPVQGAHVAFYTLEGNEFRGLGFLAGKKPGFISAVANDGTFTFTLPPNKYVVIARKNQAGSKIIPLRAGDLYCYAPTNPIEVKSGKTVGIELPCYPKGDRLSFVNSPKLKGNDYLTVESLKGLDQGGIKGRITDALGKPAPGIFVIAYRVDASKLNHETKSITQSDVDGRYFIRLESSGSYGLVARQALGGAPDPEELTGLHQDNPWKGILFQAGKTIDHVDITIKKDSSPDNAQGKKTLPGESEHEEGE